MFISPVGRFWMWLLLCVWRKLSVGRRFSWVDLRCSRGGCPWDDPGCVLAAIRRCWSCPWSQGARDDLLQPKDVLLSYGRPVAEASVEAEDDDTDEENCESDEAGDG